MHIHVCVCLSELLLGVVAPRSGTKYICVCVVVHVVYYPMSYTEFDKCLIHVKISTLLDSAHQSKYSYAKQEGLSIDQNVWHINPLGATAV